MSTANSAKNKKSDASKTKKELLDELKELKTKKPEAKDDTVKVMAEMQAQMQELMRENRELKAQAERGSNVDKVVGIRSITFATVWLPDPESFGNREARDKGKLLKPFEVTTVPYSWAVYYVANNLLPFRLGEVIFDNEAAQKSLPFGTFAEIEPREEWADNIVDITWLKRTIRNNPKELNEFIEKNKDNYLVISKLNTTLDEISNKISDEHLYIVEGLFAKMEPILFPDDGARIKVRA